MGPRKRKGTVHRRESSEDSADSDSNDSTEIIPVSSRSRRNQPVQETSVADDQERIEIIDDNTSQRLKQFIIDSVWNDFIIETKTELHEISDELLEEWMKKAGKKVKGKKSARAKLTCPNENCDRVFSCVGGIKYHYQRCNIQNAVSESICKLCNHSESLSKRMIPHMVEFHLQELPPVPDDCKPVIQQIKARIDLKANSSRPSPREPRRFTQPTYEHSFEAYLEYRRRVEATNSSQNNWMKQLMPLKKHWQRCKQFNLFTNQTEDDEITFKYSSDQEVRTFKFFDSSIDTDPGEHKTFMLDGPVISAAWVPYPSEECEPFDQLIALGCCLNRDTTHAYYEEETEHSVVHLWNVGPLSKKMDEKLPQLEFSITIDSGVVWDIQWAPYGSSWMPSNEKVASTQYPRLGLLACACSDGEVKIMSIPHPSALPKARGKNYSTYFKTTANIILCPPGVGPATANQYSICKCVSWSVNNEMKFIAAGYGNGIACIWDISTSSPFYVIDTSSESKMLSCKHSWFAHKSAISSICFNPDAEASEFTLITSGTIDREVKRWHVNDLSIGESLDKRSFITDMIWPYTWAKQYVFVAYDDAFTSLQKANSTYATPLTDEYSHHYVSRHFSTVNSLSFSDWLDSQVSSDNEGHVALHLMYLGKEIKMKEREIRTCPLYRLTLFPLDSSDQENQPTQANGENGLAFHTFEGIKNIKGVEIVDFDLSAPRSIPSSETKRLFERATDGQNHPSQYPLIAINQVKWNPNYSSYRWIFSGAQNGFCRVSLVNHPMLEKIGRK